MIGSRQHDPERSAAAYVSGEMRRRESRRFEAHLLGCDECWREVSLGREGRRLVDASRAVAPPGLRDDVRAAVSLAPSPRRLPRRVAVASAIVVLLGMSILGAWDVRSHRQPAPISAALAAARTETLVARGPSAHEPLDLSIQGLQLVMGERVDLAGLSSDAFMYRAAGGEAVLLFVSDSPFPVARGASAHATAGKGWQALSDGMTLVCGDSPVNYLVVSENPSLVGPVEHAVTAEQSWI